MLNNKFFNILKIGLHYTITSSRPDLDLEHILNRVSLAN